MSGAIIKKCDCAQSINKISFSADYQNKRYGQFMRVMNVDQKGSTAVCTVCGKAIKL
jgi:hypothetical protein